MSNKPMLISSKLHSFRNFFLQRYKQMIKYLLPPRTFSVGLCYIIVFFIVLDIRLIKGDVPACDK